VGILKVRAEQQAGQTERLHGGVRGRPGEEQSLLLIVQFAFNIVHTWNVIPALSTLACMALCLGVHSERDTLLRQKISEQ
jgi:hypothetical protein